MEKRDPRLSAALEPAGRPQGPRGETGAGPGSPDAPGPEEHWRIQEEHWRAAYASRPYVTSGAPFQAFAIAYRFGWEAALDSAGRRFEDVESELSRRWRRERGPDRLRWEHARPAVLDAWIRALRPGPG